MGFKIDHFVADVGRPNSHIADVADCRANIADDIRPLIVVGNVVDVGPSGL
jgi:hypothetical protein